MRLIGGEWKRCKACSRPVLIRRGLDLSFVTLKCSCLLYSFEGATNTFTNPVAIAEWIHLFPSRTQSLSTHTSKVLGWRRPGRIESCWFHSSIAQLVERLTVNQVVAGSIPARGAILPWGNWGIAKSVKARDFDSRIVGSSPATPASMVH